MAKYNVKSQSTILHRMSSCISLLGCTQGEAEFFLKFDEIKRGRNSDCGFMFFEEKESNNLFVIRSVFRKWKYTSVYLNVISLDKINPNDYESFIKSQVEYYQNKALEYGDYTTPILSQNNVNTYKISNFDFEIKADPAGRGTLFTVTLHNPQLTANPNLTLKSDSVSKPVINQTTSFPTSNQSRKTEFLIKNENNIEEIRNSKENSSVSFSSNPADSKNKSNSIWDTFESKKPLNSRDEKISQNDSEIKNRKISPEQKIPATPSEVSANTLSMMDSAVENLNRGIVSENIFENNYSKTSQIESNINDSNSSYTQQKTQENTKKKQGFISSQYLRPFSIGNGEISSTRDYRRINKNIAENKENKTTFNNEFTNQVPVVEKDPEIKINSTDKISDEIALENHRKEIIENLRNNYNSTPNDVIMVSENNYEPNFDSNSSVYNDDEYVDVRPVTNNQTPNFYGNHSFPNYDSELSVGMVTPKTPKVEKPVEPPVFNYELEQQKKASFKEVKEYQETVKPLAHPEPQQTFDEMLANANSERREPSLEETSSFDLDAFLAFRSQREEKNMQKTGMIDIIPDETPDINLGFDDTNAGSSMPVFKTPQMLMEEERQMEKLKKTGTYDFQSLINEALSESKGGIW